MTPEELDRMIAKQAERMTTRVPVAAPPTPPPQRTTEQIVQDNLTPEKLKALGVLLIQILNKGQDAVLSPASTLTVLACTATVGRLIEIGTICPYCLHAREELADECPHEYHTMVQAHD